MDGLCSDRRVLRDLPGVLGYLFRSGAPLRALPAVVVFAVLFVPLFDAVFDYAFWRHDSMAYLDTYDGKLASEGRWLNHLLFPLLRLVPPTAAWMAGFALAFGVFFLAALRILGDRLHACLFACACLASPTFFAQMNWPLTTLPALVVLAGAAAVARRLPYPVVLSVSGILLGGAMQGVYFLLPIVCMGGRESAQNASWRWWGGFLSFWVAGFAAGHGVAQAVTWWHVGRPIQPAAWRDFEPVTGAETLLRNTGESAARAMEQVSALMPTLPVVLVLFLAGAAFLRARRGPGDWHALAIGVTIGTLVALSFHAATVPMGFDIPYRAAFSLHVGVLVALLSFRHVAPQAGVVWLLVLLIAVPSARLAHGEMRWYAETTAVMAADLTTVTAAPGRQQSVIVADVRGYGRYRQSVARRTEAVGGLFFMDFDYPYGWRPVSLEAGFDRVVLCAPLYRTPENARRCERGRARFRDGCIGAERPICTPGVSWRGERFVTLAP